MNKELYSKLFSRMEELGVIRKDPPVLSDVLRARNIHFGMWHRNGTSSDGEIICTNWDLSEPYLKDQSDELGKYLLSLLK